MTDTTKPRQDGDDPAPATPPKADAAAKPKPVEEIGGPDGPDPTRFGDWSVNGRCIDF